MKNEKNKVCSFKDNNDLRFKVTPQHRSNSHWGLPVCQLFPPPFLLKSSMDVRQDTDGKSHGS